MVNGQNLKQLLEEPKISRNIIFPNVTQGVNIGGRSQQIDQLFLRMNQTEIDEAYGDATRADKCVMWLMPFRNMLWERTYSKF